MNDVNINEKIDGVLEVLAYGGQMTLIGLASVFSVLIIILLSIKLLQFTLTGASKEKSTSSVESTVTAETSINKPTDSSEEIIAVIAAAIATAESESGGVKFKVVSFRKK